MSMKNGILVAATLLSACGSGSGQAATGQARTAQASPAKLDVAGVRPGMPAADVRAALERGGWTVSSFPGHDWAAVVQDQAQIEGKRQFSILPKNGIETINGKKGDESVIVIMRAVPSGAIAQRVRYEAPMAGRTADQIRAQMLQRYGRPDVARPGSLVDMNWCTGGEVCRNAYNTRLPALDAETDVYDKVTVTAYEGKAIDDLWRAKAKLAVGGGARPASSF